MSASLVGSEMCIRDRLPSALLGRTLRAATVQLRLKNAQGSVLPTVRFLQHGSIPENFGVDAEALAPLEQLRVVPFRLFRRR
eukprot:1925542-Alexandrium_andersonii.AAC.1